MTMMALRSLILTLLLADCTAFAPFPFRNVGLVASPGAAARYSTNGDSESTKEEKTFDTIPTVDDLEEAKSQLVFVATQSPKASLQRIREAVDKVESLGEQVGVGQMASSSGLLNGEWELLYAPDDITRSSPFFWAFRRAFPDSADQIFDITDNIPAPLKEVGPAFQTFNIDGQSGRFVSKVKVATLGGVATSIMTTRAAVVGTEGLDGIKLKIETTKPEESTILQSLGPLGAAVNENTPAFPSGQALEQVAPGSSTVIMRNTFCDEGLRISRNNDSYNDVFIWRRREFASFEML